MKLAWRKARLMLHLAKGYWLVTVRFPRASAARQDALNQAWSRDVLRLCGIRLVVHHDAARIDQGVLMVSNHVSWMDISVINAWRPTPFVSKAEVRHWPLVGWLAQRVGTVFIQRENRRDARRIMHELAERLTAGERMCLFPEGTTSSGTALLPFHANLLQAAVSAACPVQPVCLMYEDAAGRQSAAPAYIGEMSLAASLDAILRQGPLTAHLHIGQPLDAGTNRRQLAQRAQAAVGSALCALQQRKQNNALPAMDEPVHVPAAALSPALLARYETQD
ncbi:lysophospholipid acyltransferase family protein [Paraburkholderia hayleyella]|uniref:lysophospholipid acyltransferase family protein n=1 Tax=Paraburkholderia hayleyella TaxID=2152889 RepID=UPI001292852E|nr:lysophospholipid acyltransferase family protein [Paraburkholderia hayleyella]